MTVSAKDVQRLFLQAVLSRGVLSGKLAQTLWAKSKDAVMAADDSLEIPHSDTREEWDAFVIKVNQALDPLDLEFRHLQEETSGREMYAIYTKSPKVNRKGDEIAQMATDYTPGEIAFFKAMVGTLLRRLAQSNPLAKVEQIMLAPRESFSISSLAALREVSALKPKSNMSKTQAEVVLASFVAKGWLLKSKQVVLSNPRGRYSLSARALLELEPYLKSTYSDEILECLICNEIMTKGVACPIANCKVRMHFHCFIKYTSRNRKCPTCASDWPGTDPKNMGPVGEGAVRDGDDGKRRVRKSVENSDDDEEEENEEMDDEPSQPTQPRTQRSRKAKGKPAANESMEVDEEQDEAEDSDTPVKTQGKRRVSRRS
ncbi:Non-structural maintenance of chromosomes element 1 [Mycena sanguinolenta]|uniref:Non-structural maintenance of chromosomes element 1 homolog n=1 Tax=Mycena sanguinolenta TaxID=230812 RepID=A0A8H7D5U1_9AGAR|nr:Non-structural maintenance of chromosomes element 1 [Mycena sanguinolenta]